MPPLGESYTAHLDTSMQLQRCRARISGPLLDRIGIHVEVLSVRYAELPDATPSELSSAIRDRGNAARERQQARVAFTPVPA